MWHFQEETRTAHLHGREECLEVQMMRRGIHELHYPEEKKWEKLFAAFRFSVY
jgi:hypothetical protein